MWVAFKILTLHSNQNVKTFYSISQITLADKHGRNALHYAADSGKSKNFIYDLWRKGNAFIFIMSGESKIMDLLLKNGANANSTDIIGKTASEIVKNKGKCENSIVNSSIW